MSLTEILTKCHEQGVILKMKGDDRLEVCAPEDVWSDALQQELKANKAGLLAVLKAIEDLDAKILH